MSIEGLSGVGVNSYESGYKTKKSDAASEVSFLNNLSGKTTSEKIDYDDKAFAYMAPNASEEVRNAWMEAAKETGVNGMGMTQDGKLSHISAMQVNRVEQWLNNGKAASAADLLGDTVESALQAAKEALYDLENPLQPVSHRSIEVQQQIIKEKLFYQAFIGKLEQLSEG